MEFTIKNSNFDIKRTFLCGQCFRWKETETGAFEGIAFGEKMRLSQNGDEVTITGGLSYEAAERYFDLGTDYGGYIERLSEDDTLKMACEKSHGIRLLRQEPFETLISFIISQNNNIPRISGIIERLCEMFGEKIDGGYAFPTAEKLKGITAEELSPLRAGFRARYIADAADKVNSGDIDFDEIDRLPLDEARKKLKNIVGVGDKVADCVLLFAFRKLCAFPKDVWVKRVMEQYYPDGLPSCTQGIEGIAQQYLFDWIRNNEPQKA